MSAAAKLLFFSGSTREGSLNAKLAALAHKTAELNGIEATLITLKDYPLPLYDGDLEAAEGIPEPARKLKALMQHHNGIFVASPEYNGGMSPLLKNTIDWLSRVNDEDMKASEMFRSRAFAFGSVAASEMGGIRGLIQLRQVLAVALGAHVIGGQVQVAGGPDNFDDDGNMTDERRFSFLKANVEMLARTASALFPLND